MLGDDPGQCTGAFTDGTQVNMPFLVVWSNWLAAEVDCIGIKACIRATSPLKSIIFWTFQLAKVVHIKW